MKSIFVLAQFGNINDMNLATVQHVTVFMLCNYYQSVLIHILTRTYQKKNVPTWKKTNKKQITENFPYQKADKITKRMKIKAPNIFIHKWTRYQRTSITRVLALFKTSNEVDMQAYLYNNNHFINSLDSDSLLKFGPE